MPARRMRAEEAVLIRASKGRSWQVIGFHGFGLEYEQRELGRKTEAATVWSTRTVRIRASKRVGAQWFSCFA
jgi:hypothetical protein